MEQVTQTNAPNDLNALDCPTADVVALSAYDQVRWERDTAIAQLAEIGKGFGETMDDVVEVVRCKDCKHREGSACDYSAVWVRDNGFCHCGERKDKDE